MTAIAEKPEPDAGRIPFPLPRLAPRAANEADLILYLTSDEASFVTGQICDVAGGLLMT